jgi:hypothetical protein
MEQRVSISISDGIADVRLVRADKMNALDAAMFEALVAATERLAHEKGVRVVVLSGEGRAFCAGLDTGRFAAMKESGGNGIAGGEKRDLAARTHSLANFPQQAVWGWRQLPVPVIAAIQGVAFGGGFQLALGPTCAHASRTDVDHGVKWGLVPDMAARRSSQAWSATISCATSPYRPHLFRAGSELWSPTRMLTRLLRPGRARNRRQESRCDPRRQAPAEQLSVDPGPALLARSVEQQKLLGSPNQPKPCAQYGKARAAFAEAR